MSSHVFDKFLELRDVTAGAVTATGSTTGVNMEVRYLLPCSVEIYVSAIDATSADETYTFSVQVSDVVGGTYTTIAGPIAYARGLGAGKVSIPISAELAQWVDADSAFIRITHTLGGTTPSVTYGAYLAKSHTMYGRGVDVRQIV